MSELDSLSAVKCNENTIPNAKKTKLPEINRKINTSGSVEGNTYRIEDSSSNGIVKCLEKTVNVIVVTRKTINSAYKNQN